jgi:hypothetical protein
MNIARFRIADAPLNLNNPAQALPVNLKVQP